MTRSRGTFGEVSRALLAAAATSPGTVQDLAIRAQVGSKVARYTASRLVKLGELEAVNLNTRPSVLRIPTERPSVSAARVADAIAGWFRT